MPVLVFGRSLRKMAIDPHTTTESSLSFSTGWLDKPRQLSHRADCISPTNSYHESWAPICEKSITLHNIMHKSMNSVVLSFCCTSLVTKTEIGQTGWVCLKKENQVSFSTFFVAYPEQQLVGMSSSPGVDIYRLLHKRKGTGKSQTEVPLDCICLVRWLQK